MPTRPSRLGKPNPWAKDWNDRNPEKVKEYRRRSKIKQKYGLDWQDYEAILSYPCLICGSEENIVLDHCHTGGYVRGPLCNHCNLGIGHFKENQANLAAAIRYLQSCQ